MTPPSSAARAAKPETSGDRVPEVPADLEFTAEERAAMLEESGVELADELAYLRGEGPDPWHG